MSVKLLTLSSSGTLEFPQQIIDRLFIYFVKSSKKQSRLYRNHVTSYKWLEHMYGDDKDLFAEETSNALQIMYERYFDDVNIEVVFIQQDDALFNAVISGTMSYEGKKFTLEKRVTN